MCFFEKGLGGGEGLSFSRSSLLRHLFFSFLSFFPPVLFFVRQLALEAAHSDAKESLEKVSHVQNQLTQLSRQADESLRSGI